MRDPAEANQDAETTVPTDEDAVWRLATVLASATTVDEVAEALVQQGGGAAGGSFANLAVLDAGTGLVRIVHYRSVDGTSTPIWRTYNLNDQVPACEAMRSGLPVLLGSIEEIRERFPWALAEIEHAGLNARASLPIHSPGGDMSGAVGFGWAEEQSFSAAQLRRLDLIAQLAALAFERAIGSDAKELSAIGFHAVETMPSALFAMDREWRITYVNPEAERLLGASKEHLLGTPLNDVFPGFADSEFERRYREAFSTGRPVLFEEYYAPLDGWFEVHAWPQPRGLNVTFSNIDERRMAEAERLTAFAETKKANERLTFLTDLSTRIAGSGTKFEVLERLSKAVIPVMADWCTLVVPRGEELVRIAATHRDPVLDGLARRLIGRYPHHFSGPSPGVVVYRSGEPLQLTRLAQQIIVDLDNSTASAAYGRTLLHLGDGPGLIWPVIYRNEVIAVLTMVRSSGRPFTDDDLATMREAVDRVVACLDEASHVESQREAAAALQAAALPKMLPRSSSLELAAGYRPASEGSQVGGDWYDAFVLPNDRIALVVGDAAGHGLQAAAVMTQMRNVLRANLFSSMDPAEALTGLDALLTAQEGDVFGTVVCAEIDTTSGETVWASAGHPSPILVSGDATSIHLTGRTAPPIGCADLGSGTKETLNRLTLEPFDRLILFTDGLVEHRHVNLDIGITHLMILAEQSQARIGAESACEAILDGLLPETHEDDVCLLIADFLPRAPGQ